MVTPRVAAATVRTAVAVACAALVALTWTPTARAQETERQKLQKLADATTVAVFLSRTVPPGPGRPAERTDKLPASAVVIGSVQQFYYALTILSPCYVRWSDDMTFEVAELGQKDTTRAALVTFNPMTGVALLVFRRQSTTPLDPIRPSDAELRKAAELRLAAAEPAADPRAGISITLYDALLGDFIVLGALIDSTGFETKTELIGGPAFFPRGDLAGLVAVHRKNALHPEAPRACADAKRATYLVPARLATEVVAHLVTQGVEPQLAQLSTRLTRVDADVTALGTAHTEGLVATSTDPGARGEERLRALQALRRVRTLEPPHVARLIALVLQERGLQIEALRLLADHATLGRASEDVHGLLKTVIEASQYRDDVRREAVKIYGDWRTLHCDARATRWFDGFRATATYSSDVIAAVQDVTRVEPRCAR